ncbi:hypothetical protein GCM10023191_034770 [Actinoallomurus oryzae]|uniref:Glucosamine/galactosamine-6-phosphate isomerase domain-containing protein n=1 Tax=Actinoallomurus oryzae TaxID=502180 RepID=A0ABP8PZ03_9ACTN
MHINVVESLAQPVGELWRDLQAKETKDGFFSVAAPLSSTPRPIYRWIVDNASMFERWKAVRFVLMDEQIEGSSVPFRYISPEDPASYERFAMQNLLIPLEGKTGTAVRLEKPDLDRLETFSPKINLLMVALGVRGNYANVMPGTDINTGWHVTRLIEEFRQVHTQASSDSYAGAAFREFGMSLGPQQVLEADNVVVIISGSKKRALAEELLSYKAFTPEFPLSIIHEPSVRQRVQIFATPDTGIRL